MRQVSERKDVSERTQNHLPGCQGEGNGHWFLSFPISMQSCSWLHSTQHSLLWLRGDGMCKAPHLNWLHSPPLLCKEKLLLNPLQLKLWRVKHKHTSHQPQQSCASSSYPSHQKFCPGKGKTDFITTIWFVCKYQHSCLQPVNTTALPKNLQTAALLQIPKVFIEGCSDPTSKSSKIHQQRCI